MMRIERHRYAQRMLSLFGLIAVIFLSALSYFLGWDFEWTTFGIFLAIVAGECLIFFLLYLLLRQFDWGYFLIDSNGIKFYKKKQEVFAIQSSEVINIRYTSFWYTLLLQMGSGYLFITHTSQSNESRTIEFPNANPIYCLSASPKEAQKIATILDKKLN